MEILFTLFLISSTMANDSLGRDIKILISVPTSPISTGLESNLTEVRSGVSEIIRLTEELKEGKKIDFEADQGEYVKFLSYIQELKSRHNYLSVPEEYVESSNSVSEILSEFEKFPEFMEMGDLKSLLGPIKGLGTLLEINKSKFFFNIKMYFLLQKLKNSISQYANPLEANVIITKIDQVVKHWYQIFLVTLHNIQAEMSDYFLSPESEFRRHLEGYQEVFHKLFRIEIEYFASADQLEEELNNPNNYAVIWVSHAPPPNSPFGATEIVDRNGENVSHLFSRINQNIRFLGVASCFSLKSIKYYNNIGFYESSPNLSFFTSKHRLNFLNFPKQVFKNLLDSFINTEFTEEWVAFQEIEPMKKRSDSLIPLENKACLDFQTKGLWISVHLPEPVGSLHKVSFANQYIGSIKSGQSKLETFFVPKKETNKTLYEAQLFVVGESDVSRAQVKVADVDFRYSKIENSFLAKDEIMQPLDQLSSLQTLNGCQNFNSK